MAGTVEVSASAQSCPFGSDLVRLGLGTDAKRDILLARIADESVLERYPAIPGPCCIRGWAGG